MKLLLANTYAQSGGASIVARRLCHALCASGQDAHLLVQHREEIEDPLIWTTQDRWASCRSFWDKIPALPYRNRRSPHWGNAWVNNFSTRNRIMQERPDILHLHWINHGFLSISDIVHLSVHMPLIWTWHDSWGMTGGCHIPQDCTRFEASCGSCPELRSNREHDLSRRNWRRKHADWANFRGVIVTPSQWLASRAKKSSLFHDARIEVIPNALDTETFYPRNKQVAREALKLPQEVPLVLFGAFNAMQDWNKGGDLLQDALKVVARKNPAAQVMVAGSTQGPEVDLPTHGLGSLSASQMADAMSAADLTVIPSRTETLPNMAAESLACGTPVVAFSVGGIPEVIRHGESGWLASPYDPSELAKGILELLADSERRRQMGEAGRQFVCNHYAPETIASRHMELYHAVQAATLM